MHVDRGDGMRWEIPTVFQALDENIFWHIPRRGPRVFGDCGESYGDCGRR